MFVVILLSSKFEFHVLLLVAGIGVTPRVLSCQVSLKLEILEGGSFNR